MPSIHDFMLTKEEAAVVGEVRAFVKSVDPDLIRAMEADKVRYPREYLVEAGRRNLLGLRFPREYGGRGASWKVEMAAIEEVGVLGASLGCLYSLPSIVGEAIASFGTGRQKEKYLRPTLAGRLTCAEALTEPRGGSDFFGAATTAVRSGNSFVLNGQKRFIVGAEGADYFFVYAKTSETPDGRKGISAFLVEREMGVKVENIYNLMGTRGGGTGRIVFKDVEVPAENLVGELGGGAAIFNRMMVPERMTSAAGALGTARAAVEIAARYSMSREAFGQKIRNFEGVSFRVADSVMKLDAARSLICTAAIGVDAGLDMRRLVSEAKRFSTESAWDAINQAMQVMGGIGYTDIYPIERFLRDGRLALIWTGTNEVMNLLIQHEYYKEIAESTGASRDVEHDAPGWDKEGEKVFG